MKARQRPKLITVAAAVAAALGFGPAHKTAAAKASTQASILPPSLPMATAKQVMVFGAPNVRSTGVAAARRSAKKRRRMLAKLPK